MDRLLNNASNSDILDSIFTVNLDPIGIIDSTGNLLKINPVWESLFGYSEAELTMRSYFELIHADDADMTRTIIINHREDAGSYHFTNRLICKDGTSRYIEWRARSYTDYTYLSARDITERILYQQQIEEKQGNLNSFFEAVDDLIFIADTQGRLFHVNQAVVNKLGYTYNELISMHILDIHPPIYRDEAAGILGAMFSGMRDFCPL